MEVIQKKLEFIPKRGTYTCIQTKELYNGIHTKEKNICRHPYKRNNEIHAKEKNICWNPYKREERISESIQSSTYNGIQIEERNIYKNTFKGEGYKYWLIVIRNQQISLLLLI